MYLCLYLYLCSQDGCTAIHLAADRKWESCVQFLIQNGADVNKQNNVSAAAGCCWLLLLAAAEAADGCCWLLAADGCCYWLLAAEAAASPAS